MHYRQDGNGKLAHSAGEALLNQRSKGCGVTCRCQVHDGESLKASGSVGAFLFLVAFVGCCGACKENYCLMITFAIFLSLIMLVEVAAAIAGYEFRDKVRSEFNKDFRQQMKNYPKANETASILDKMQKDFKCCGAANYTDWEKIPTMASRVPDSCCVNITNNCGVHFVVKDIHTEGCVEKIAAWLRKNVLVVAAAALGIAFVEILGIVLACCLVKSIRSGYEVM
ncbi:hypothetical protein JEQ12_005283 [Ovis aries]|uniref:CD63 antigen n=1 Tax=Ovis aries TaxID=9940 RepID=A0A835ZWH9_SHEEP|nr:hypothetical protein JEQ12_005283 [Ovis aries]